MMVINYFKVLLVLLLLGLTNNEELKGQGVSDSLVLSYDEYLENILIYHPIARQADLKQKIAETQLMKARGFLDPEITAGWNEKSFDDKLYYRKYGAKLRFPTSIGLDVVGAYENTQGDYLNPENKTDEFGLWHVGLELNILNGLLVNERSTAIKKAKVYQSLAENEQQVLLNELMYAAVSAYLTWQKYYFSLEVLEENKAIAKTYFDNTRQAFLNGEKTSMDTLEASIAYQEADNYYLKNEMYLVKARQIIENYLWFENMPISLQDDAIPEYFKTPFFENIAVYDVEYIESHPKILAAINKLSMAEIDQRLKREKFKPKLKLKYNPLLKTSDSYNIHSFSASDYKLGFEFSMPLTFRKERADVNMGKLKIQDMELDVERKRNELLNKTDASWEQQLLLKRQIDIQNQNVVMYRQLLDGESEKFKYGESSVFLLNKRQEKYINSQLKLTDAYIMQQLEVLNFLYYSNQLLAY
ncbi:TolC family protein [Carboxylicivirga sp. N1Y90]|uniref:TolC family protein n=1 Tax=Carboxylicivirga fragile TaxID=3417571 RepID=UPI003D32CE41|nr:TolC family protein [Marinilabiliaceae bacterium N1Y90]